MFWEILLERKAQNGLKMRFLMFLTKFFIIFCCESTTRKAFIGSFIEAFQNPRMLSVSQVDSLISEISWFSAWWQTSKKGENENCHYKWEQGLTNSCVWGYVLQYTSKILGVHMSTGNQLLKDCSDKTSTTENFTKITVHTRYFPVSLQEFKKQQGHSMHLAQSLAEIFLISAQGRRNSKQCLL